MLGQIVRRMRAERTFPVAQTAVLGRLDREGALSVSDLAHAERVRPQSMAQTVKDMEDAGLVTRRDDPHDRRRSLVELTQEGGERLRADRRNSEGWLARGIAEDLSADERRQLTAAVSLLKRLSER